MVVTNTIHLDYYVVGRFVRPTSFLAEVSHLTLEKAVDLFRKRGFKVVVHENGLVEVTPPEGDMTERMTWIELVVEAMNEDDSC